MATILLMLGRAANRRLMFEYLARDHTIKSAGPDDPVPKPFDMAFVDGQVLERRGDELAAYRTEQQPVLAPLVLLVPESRIRQLPTRVWKQVDDVIAVPVTKAALAARLGNLLRLRHLSELQERRSTNLRSFNEMLSERIREQTVEMRDSFIESVFILTKAAEFRDTDTGVHVRRISHYSKFLADRLGMDSAFQDQIFYASPMHDVGKLGIPDSILLKEGPLSEVEWDIMKTHPTIGSQILRQGHSPYLAMGAEIAEAHHERWDGSGYPAGLAKEEIPLPARIMAVCDVYDALRSKRPYKRPLDHTTAVGVITFGDDRTRPEHFDPGVIAAFAKASRDFEEIFDNFDR